MSEKGSSQEGDKNFGLTPKQRAARFAAAAVIITGAGAGAVAKGCSAEMQKNRETQEMEQIEKAARESKIISEMYSSYLLENSEIIKYQIQPGDGEDSLASETGWHGVSHPEKEVNAEGNDNTNYESDEILSIIKDLPQNKEIIDKVFDSNIGGLRLTNFNPETGQEEPNYIYLPRKK